MLTVEERRLIFQYCWDHPVASCGSCQHDYRLPELGADAADILRDPAWGGEAPTS